MMMAVNELRAMRVIDDSCQYVDIVGTFNGAYQQRSRKSGVGSLAIAFLQQ